MIKIKNLSKSYGGQRVLVNVNLEIEEGEIHGLLGVSGVGKSTLLRCLNGLETYEEGSIQIFGQEVKELRGRALNEFRKKIGMIFQDFALLERKTVLKNVQLPMECWHYPKEKMAQRARYLLKVVGLEDKANVRPTELSGGQKQRVAIARTLTLEPQLLLCDEGTSALDPMTTQSILSLLKSIQSSLDIGLRLGIIVVTHQLEVIKQICDKVSIMENGRITASGRVADIFVSEPDALLRLTGQPAIRVPAGKAGFRITLDPTRMALPVLSELALDLQSGYNLLYAGTDVCGDEMIGHFYLAVDQDTREKVSAWLRGKNIVFSPFEGDSDQS